MTSKGIGMPLQSMLVRLRTVEIFGTLLPGLFFIVSLGIVRTSTKARDWWDMERRITAFMTTDPRWISIAIFIVASYFCGSLIRVLPGRIVDNLIGRALRPLFKRKFFGPRINALYEGYFPYPKMLCRVHEELERCGYLDALSNAPSWMLTSLRGDIESSSFEYWKAFVAARNLGLASRHEASESRTRLFYGMFWATALALAISLLGWLIAPTYLPLTWGVVSACMLFVFAARYRHVTGEEVRDVYISFLTQTCIDRQRQSTDGPNASFSSVARVTEG